MFRCKILAYIYMMLYVIVSYMMYVTYIYMMLYDAYPHVLVLPVRTNVMRAGVIRG